MANCVIPSREAVSEALAKDFKTLTYKLRDSGMSLDSAASSVYMYLSTDPQYRDNEKYEFALPMGYMLWLQNTHPKTANRVVDPKKYKGIETKPIEDKFLPKNYVEILDEYLDTDESTNVEERENTGASDYRTAGLDFLNSIFFRGIKKQILKSEYMDLADAAREETFDETLDTFGEAYEPNLLLSNTALRSIGKAEFLRIKDLKNNLKEWYNANLKVNKRLRTEIQEYSYIDFEVKKVKTADGGYKEIIYKPGQEDINKPGTFHLDVAPDVNYVSGRKESSSSSVSFLQEEKQPYGVDDPTQTLDANTGYLPFKNIVTAKQNRETKDIYYQQANQIIDFEFLSNLNTALVNNSKELYGDKTIVASASGSSSKVYIANILKEHIETVIPQSKIDEAIKAGDLSAFMEARGFDGEATLQFFKKHDNNIHKVLKELRKDPKKNHDRIMAVQSMADIMADGSYTQWVKDQGFSEVVENDFLDIINNYKIEKVNGSLYMELASQVAKHRWWQTATIPDYWKNKDSQNTGEDGFGLGNSPMDYFDRLKIGGGKGVVVVGASGTRTLLINPKDQALNWTFNGKKINPMKPIDALGGKQDDPDTWTYLGDGTLFRDSSSFDDWAAIVGHEALYKNDKGLTSAKTVRRIKTEEGFALDKSLSTIAPPGLKVTDSKGRVVLETKLENGKVVMTGGPLNSPINEFLTTDERKVAVGKLNKQGVITETPNGSERIMIKPGKKSHSDVAFPVQLIDLLEHTGLRETKAGKILEKHMMNVMKDSMNDIINMIDNPARFKKAVEKMFQYNGEKLKSEAEKVFRLFTGAEDHPMLMSYFIPMLKNRYITNGMFKLRARDKKDYGGSYFELKWDIGEEVKENHVMISPNNQKMFKVVGRRYFKTINNEKKEEFKGASKEEQVEILNAFLESNAVHALISRHPVDSKSAVRLKRIQKFSGTWDSDAAYLHPDFVYGPLRADHDGDHVNVEVLPDDITKELLPYLGPGTPFKDDVVDLKWFKDKFSKLRLTKKSDFFESMAAVVGAAGSAMGMAYNMRTVRGNLVKKKFEITLSDGSKLIPIKPEEKVVMDYIELADDFNPTDDDMTKYKIEIIKASELGDQKFERGLPEEFATTARALDADGQPTEMWQAVIYKDGRIIKRDDEKRYANEDAIDVRHRAKKMGLNVPYYPRKDAAQISKQTASKPKTGRYVEVTSEHEMAIIANAATDNPKKLKLHQMGFNGDSAFFLSKYFWHVDPSGNKHKININLEDSDDYGREIIKILKQVGRYFNHSEKRRGSIDGRESSMNELWTMSETISEINNLTSEEYMKFLNKKIKSKLIDSIKLENNPTTVEKMLAAPSDILRKEMPEENYPWSSVDPSNKGLSGVHTWNTHHLAMQMLDEQLGGNPMTELNISNEARKLGEAWIGKYADAFYNKFIERKGKVIENYNPSINKQDFDEGLLKWKREAQKELDAYVEQQGEGVKTYITLAFLDGIGRDLKGRRVKEVNHIPSVDLLDTNLLTAYKDAWSQTRSMALKGQEMVAKTEASSIIKEC